MCVIMIRLRLTLLNTYRSKYDKKRVIMNKSKIVQNINLFYKIYFFIFYFLMTSKFDKKCCMIFSLKAKILFRELLKIPQKQKLKYKSDLFPNKY